MLPSSSDLNYFLAIAHAGNLTHAASKLGVSQPSLTLAIQRLENGMGTSLFIRSRQGVKLTKAGDRLLVEARQLMERWELLKQEAYDSMNEVRGRFIIGCHPSVAKYSLPLFLPEILKEHPHLEIRLVHDLSRHITSKILSMEVDLGIVVNPQEHLDLVIKQLAQDSVTLWKSKNLRNEDILICEPSLLQTQDILAKLKRSGFEFKRVVESSNLEVVAAMIESGVGLGILPARVAYAHSEELIKIRDAPQFADRICLIYRVENKGVRAVQALSTAIQTGFSSVRR